MINPVIPSISVTSTREERYRSSRLSRKPSSSVTTADTPTPYIGHQGPLRNPLFTNLLSFTVA